MIMSPMICINKISIALFFLIFSTLLLTTLSGGRTNVVKLANQQLASPHQEVSEGNKMEEESMIKERILRANNRDYGHYDPAPALVRPPFKLIPN